jgi:hypothetical protein
MPDAVDTVVCAPDDGWRCHPKRVEQFPDIINCVMLVPVTMAWRILRLRMEERHPIWRVTVNKLNKQPRTADERWSSSLGVGQGANNPSP